MEKTAVRRRLAAVLAADMVGYSRLMEADEAGTLARLKAHRLELIDPAISKNDGRIIKTTGDGMLVEFGSVVDAVRCAVEIQERLQRRNTDVPADNRIEFRVGINLGDVIVEEDDIFGDGVNIAARLQQISEPGTISVSQAVRDQVGDRLEVHFEDLGEETLKNIARPVRVHRVVLGGGASAAAAPATPKAAEAAEGAIDKPSIVVLPFVNMSGDPEQEFFADGMTEDILTALSRFRHLFVISRTTAFKYKNKGINLQDVAKELGVQYVLEGSVRKAGNRVRVTVQLIDAEADRHVWAERYDRDLEDIFAIQDELTSAIVATLPGRLEAATQERAKRRPTGNLAAYEYVLAGKVLHHRSDREANAEALKMLDKALELDPEFAHAHAWKACTLGQTWVHNWCEDRDETAEEIEGELQIALSLDDNDSDVHRILAAINLVYDDHDKAVYHQDRALSLNPNDDLIVVQQGEVLTWIGQAEQGIEWIKKAMRLNPYHPERFWSHLGRAYYVARRCEDAVEALKHLSKMDHNQHALMAACYARLGDGVAAKRHVEQVLRLEPGFTVEEHLTTQHYKQDSDREYYRQGLIEAGLPA